MPVIPPIMKLIKEEGEINNIEMYKTFNMGIGFCIIAHEDEENKIKKICKKYKLRSQKIGNIINKKGVYINSEKIA